MKLLTCWAIGLLSYWAIRWLCFDAVKFFSVGNLNIPNSWKSEKRAQGNDGWRWNKCLSKLLLILGFQRNMVGKSQFCQKGDLWFKSSELEDLPMYICLNRSYSIQLGGLGISIISKNCQPLRASSAPPLHILCIFMFFGAHSSRRTVVSRLVQADQGLCDFSWQRLVGMN